MRLKRLLRFRLSSLMITVLVVSVLLGWYATVQRQFYAEWKALGAIASLASLELRPVSSRFLRESSGYGDGNSSQPWSISALSLL
jgi:hypothetical protein